MNIHDSRAGDIIVPDRLIVEPSIPITSCRDGFGNRCHRVLAPEGRVRLTADAVINDTGQPDEIAFGAAQDSVQNLPEEILSQTAWQLFGGTAPGFPRVRAICDYVHTHIAFNYQNARATRTAAEAYNERTGVCRDFAHLAIAFCCCMNIPARYCTGYLGNVGTSPPYAAGDFAGRGLDWRPLVGVRPA